MAARSVPTLKSREYEARQLRGSQARLVQMSSSQLGYVRGRHFLTYVDDVKRLKRSAMLAEAEQLLRELVAAVEEQARSTQSGVAPWYYEQLAIVYRKQKKYAEEVELLRRYSESPKSPGAMKAQLAQRLQTALLLLEDGGVGPKLHRLRSERSIERSVTVDTLFGPVTIDNPYGRPIAVVALGQSEEHIRWYFDYCFKSELRLARFHLHQLLRGTRPRSDFDERYLVLMHKSEALLENLRRDRDAALEANRKKIKGKQIKVLGTYDSLEEANTSAKYMSQKFEPTLNAGWNLQIMFIRHQ